MRGETKASPSTLGSPLRRACGASRLAGGAALAAGVATASAASAHGEEIDRERPSRSEAVAEARATAEAERPAQQADSEGEAERYRVIADLTLGWGKVPFAVQNLPAGGNPAVTYSRSDQTQSNVQSLLVGGSVEVASHVAVGLRFPITFAGFTPDGSSARSTSDIGNVELEGEYELKMRSGLIVTGALGVALPTAQGDAIPAMLDQATGSSVNESALDRWSLSRAAAFARGYEDNALFEPRRLGILPKLSALYRYRGLSVEPYVKLENLVGTSGALDAAYVGELVAALRVGYWIHKQFELAARGWVNVGYAGTDEDKTTAAAIEPQLVLRFGPVRPYGGVVVPLSGPPRDNSFVGVRVGLAGSF
jgi:hypothetical protein